MQLQQLSAKRLDESSDVIAYLQEWNVVHGLLPPCSHYCCWQRLGRRYCRYRALQTDCEGCSYSTAADVVASVCQFRPEGDHC